MLNKPYIAQCFPRDRAPFFVISHHVQKEYGIGIEDVIDERTGKKAEFATKDEARAVLRSLQKPAKRIAN